MLDVLGLAVDKMWIQDHGNIENRCFDYQVKRATAESQNQKGALTVQLSSPVDHFQHCNWRHCYTKAELCVFSFCSLRSLHPSVTVDLVTCAGSIISDSSIDKEMSPGHNRVYLLCMEPRQGIRKHSH